MAEQERLVKKFIDSYFADNYTGGGFLTIVLLANSISGLVESFPAYQQKLTEIFNKFSEFAASNNLNISELIQKIHITPEKVIELEARLQGV